MSDRSESSDNNVTDSHGRPISRAAAEALQTAASRIRSAIEALRVWERLFTDDDRHRLGGDVDESWRRLGTVGMWREARGGTLEQAVIEVANELSHLDDKTADWLRRELDIAVPSAEVAQDRPTWDPQRGELRWGNDVIRRVRVVQNPNNIQTVLNAFQAAGWPSRIPNPLPLGQEQLHQTLQSLNHGLSVIQFHSQEGAKAITWQRI